MSRNGFAPSYTLLSPFFDFFPLKCLRILHRFAPSRGRLFTWRMIFCCRFSLEMPKISSLASSCVDSVRDSSKIIEFPESSKPFKWLSHHTILQPSISLNGLCLLCSLSCHSRTGVFLYPERFAGLWSRCPDFTEDPPLFFGLPEAPLC